MLTLRRRSAPGHRRVAETVPSHRFERRNLTFCTDNPIMAGDDDLQ